jgi:membrane protein implicated in regulation of membrane protease activity
MAVDPDAPEVIEPGVKAERSLSTLLSDLAGETVDLFRQELALFKTELQEKLSRAGIGAAALAAAALIAFSGWLFLLLAAVFAFMIIVPAWAAALIVGVLVLAIAGVLALIGRSRMRADALTPERTLRSLRQDEAWIKERFRQPAPMTRTDARI